MSRLLTIVLSCIPLLFIGAPAKADLITLKANLTHDQEPGAGPLTTNPGGLPRPLSFGTADFVLDTTLKFMTMTVTIFNIDVTGSQTPGDSNDNLLNAHIHVGAPPGANASVRWGFFGAPQNDTTPNDRTVTPFGVGVGGTFTGKWDDVEGNGAGTTLTNQMPAILAGLSYINFHTVQFGGGEIRGQLEVVPVPATLALMALGLLCLGAMRRTAA